MYENVLLNDDEKKGDDGDKSDDDDDGPGYPNITSSGGYDLKLGCWFKINLFKKQ